MGGKPSGSTRDPNNQCRLLNLPVEVRHKIYRYLFCTDDGSVWLVSHYKLFQPLYSVTTPRADPTFEAQLFRCCKALHRDTIAFAYQVNKFELRGDLSAFTGLNPFALSCIRSLSITQVGWKCGQQDSKAWNLILSDCHNLDQFEIVVQQDTLLASVPFLLRFLNQATAQISRLALDVSIWDPHFSFDRPYRDLARSESIIKQSAADPDGSSATQNQISRLPWQARAITLTADITAGAVQALDAYFASVATVSVTKKVGERPHFGHREVAGRSTRVVYELGRT
ncbi:hypothetical protein DV737_g153, partial [Chaetothyriales sp. CBS 132003]